jgi:hypothetical protein
MFVARKASGAASQVFEIGSAGDTGAGPRHVLQRSLVLYGSQAEHSRAVHHAGTTGVDRLVFGNQVRLLKHVAAVIDSPV